MNSSVVVAAYAEGMLGKLLALGQGGLCAAAGEDVVQHLVFGLARHDHHDVEVLGGSADERKAANVNLLDDVRLAGAAFHRIFKGVEVHHYEVNLGDSVLGHLLAVALQLAATQYAAEHLGVQRLDPAAQYGGIARQVLHLVALVAKALDETLRAARGEQLHALGIQLLQDALKPIFVIDGDECRLDFLSVCHISVFFLQLLGSCL